MSRFYELLKAAGQGKATANVAVAGAGETLRNAQNNTKEGGLPSASGKGASGVQLRFADGAEVSAARNVFATPGPPPAWSPDQAAKQPSSNGDGYFVAGEEFRTLRSNLSLAREKGHLQKLLVTSPLPREGKTFIAASLALVISWQHKDRVLLVDGDLRWSRLHVCLGAPATPGLSDYLSGDVDENGIIRRGPVNNLLFIPGGNPVPNAGELIGNGRLRGLLEHLAPAFDWIIIDSPPAIPISDAKLMAGVCDGVLMVIRAGATPLELARKTYKEFRENRFVGVILNGVERAPSRKYYYDYGYYGKRERSNRSEMPSLKARGSLS